MLGVDAETGGILGLAAGRTPTGTHEFDQLCAELDIEHRLTPSKSPQTHGMVERFNGRIEEVLQSHHFRSGEELETTLHRCAALQPATSAVSLGQQDALAGDERMAQTQT